MTGIRISSDALADLDEVWFTSPQTTCGTPTGSSTVWLIPFQTLSVAPLAGRVRDELGFGLRCLPVDRYLVFYRVLQADVEVVRILHGGRDLGTVFNK